MHSIKSWKTIRISYDRTRSIGVIVESVRPTVPHWKENRPNFIKMAEVRLFVEHS